MLFNPKNLTNQKVILLLNIVLNIYIIFIELNATFRYINNYIN